MHFELLKLNYDSNFISIQTFSFVWSSSKISITHNYIIKYLIFYMESVFCDKINGTQFYRDQ
ncbi:hypothetical protein AR546_08545 [Leptospira interrogans serovar Canicola]|nr:hypothetical protein AR546_08545 [Leptospira interrogans serovar Canicola]OMH63137.1 hypothetical protein BW243_14550 [Leptospira interrogans serovar Pomona]POR18670.1 hypothetical protein B0T34_08990 [Leptospira interrogans serovar Canicola]